MIDLTKIDTPFGELDQVTQWALRGAWEAGETIQHRFPSAVSFNSHRKTESGGWLEWAKDRTYRLKPAPVVVEKTFKMHVIGGPNMDPAVVNDPVEPAAGWTPITVKVQWVDGKITDFLTELAE